MPSDLSGEKIRGVIVDMIEELRKIAYDKLNAYFGNCEREPEDLDFFAWPQMFSSTAGPSGCGGQMLSKFTIIAFVDSQNNAAVVCAGKWKIIKGSEFKPLMRVRF